jgi:hypothetical protein
MKLHNHLPILIDCLFRWTIRPTEDQFYREYASVLKPTVGGLFDNFYEALLDLDWPSYRRHALSIDPKYEESRFLENLKKVEDLFGFELSGEVFLLGTFQHMDGFARFDQGAHKVYLGLDEDHLNGRYLDILTAHELTHVARETRPEVWQGYGLDPKMSRSEYLESQTVVEHLMGEGFSCAVSEILIPGEDPWKYTYQSRDSLHHILRNADHFDRAIKSELRAQDGDYGNLYGLEPIYAHYVWAWRWVKQMIQAHANGDPRKLVGVCSKDLLDQALNFTFNG